jgi:hypothetical protein
MAAYTRAAALRSSPPGAAPVLNVRFVGQLGRLANNLNQLTSWRTRGGPRRCCCRAWRIWWRKWRKRMGIEPTSRAATARDNGFEDRKRHQPPSASGRYCSRGPNGSGPASGTGSRGGPASVRVGTGQAVAWLRYSPGGGGAAAGGAALEGAAGAAGSAGGALLGEGACRGSAGFAFWWVR